MGSKMAAIDIGSGKMKIVLGKAGKNEIIVEKMFLAQTPSDAINNGEIVDINLMREALTVAVENYSLKGKKTIVTIQSSTFISREFIIPKLKGKEIEGTLRFEIEQNMPIVLDDYVLNYREMAVLPEEDGQFKVKYMVGLMPERIVSAYYSLLRSAGLKPIIMDVNSNAIRKFINFSQDEEMEEINKRVVLIADIGNDAMDMTVFDSGVPVINRTVPIGGAEISRSIMSSFALDFKDAEIVKKDNIDLMCEFYKDDEQSRINSITKLVVSDWAEQLRRMAEFYMSRTKGRNVDCVYIYGGSSEMKGLDSYLSENFGMTVKILPLPSNVKIIGEANVLCFNFFNAIGALIRKR